MQACDKQWPDESTLGEVDDEAASPGSPTRQGDCAVLPLPNAVPLRQWRHLRNLERISHGVFGEVYRGWDGELEREVALKLFWWSRQPGMALRSAGAREARLMARIRHHNVITVYGADHHDGRLGVWMEFIRGRTLASWLKDQGPLGAGETALIGLDVCRAVAAVHGVGLLHRDIKAQNVMRQQGGRIVLMDFGLGERMESHNSHGDELLCGTPLYMAPELLRCEKATAQSDIYAIGVLLYHLACGSYPVAGRALGEVRRAHERRQLRLLRDQRPDLPETFLQTIDRALAPDLRNRFDSAGQMGQALKASLGVDHGNGTGRLFPRLLQRIWLL